MKRITYFDPHKTALTCAAVFAVGSLLFLLPMALMFAFIPASDVNGAPVRMVFPVTMILIMPVFYFIFGYISTAFFAWLYNRIASYTGGISFQTSEDKESGSTDPGGTASGIVTGDKK